jgi:enoyl-CoA hydratase/carnithine racemase
LVEEVVETGQAMDAARAMAKQACQQSPSSVAACKRLIHSARNIAITRGLAAERDEFVDLFHTEDQKEGVNAFLEKRTAQWKNR